MVRFALSRTTAYVLGVLLLALFLIAGAGTMAPRAQASGPSVAEQVVTEFRTLTDSEVLTAAGDGASIDDFVGWGSQGQKVSTVDGYAARFASSAEFVAETNKSKFASMLASRIIPALSTKLTAIGVAYTGWQIGWHIGTWFAHFAGLTTNAASGNDHLTQWVHASGFGASHWFLQWYDSALGGNLSAAFNCPGNTGSSPCTSPFGLSYQHGYALLQAAPEGDWNTCTSGVGNCGSTLGWPNKGYRTFDSLDTDPPVTDVHPYTAADAPNVTRTDTYTEPSHTASDYTNLRAAFDPGGTAAEAAAAQTDSQAAATAWIVHTAEPTWVPEPETMTWAEAAPTETYSSYVQRLRDAGWLGDATAVQLDSSTGDVDYGLDGVPCTSVASGSQIALDAPVTFLHNPTSGSFDENLSPSSGITCGAARPTSQSEPECSFYQDVGSWDEISQNSPLFYQLACESTRSHVLSLNPFGEDGTINASEITVARDIAVGEQIYGADARQRVAESGYTIGDFKYVSSQKMTDPDGREFELHFYLNTVSGKALLDPGYKIKYTHYFAP